MGMKEYARRIRNVNSAILRTIGTLLLGAAVVAAFLFVFSPIGKWTCDATDCTDEHWMLLGLTGFFATMLVIVVLGITYAIGDFTKDQAQDIVWAYRRRQHRLHNKPMPPLPGQTESADDFPHSTRPKW